MFFFLSLSSKSSSLGCAPLFSYRDSKGHHRELSHPLEVSRPFTNPFVQRNRCAPSWTWLPKNIVAPLCRLGHPNKPMHLSPVVPLGTSAPNLGAPLMPMHPNLLVASYFGNPLDVFTCPKHPLAQYGCQRNHKLGLLEDLGEGLCAYLTKGITSPPPQVVVVLNNI
jgi:hypothetical protein